MPCAGLAAVPSKERLAWVPSTFQVVVKLSSRLPVPEPRADEEVRDAATDDAADASDATNDVAGTEASHGESAHGA